MRRSRVDCQIILRLASRVSMSQVNHVHAVRAGQGKRAKIPQANYGRLDCTAPVPVLLRLF